MALGAATVTAWWMSREPIYWPWAWLGWWQALPEPLAWEGAVAFAAGAGPIAWAVWKVGSARLEELPRRGDSYGSAHFAADDEVEAAGLRGHEGGVVLGFYRDRPLRCGKDQHVLVFSPPGSGKTTALAVPTLFSWPESVVVFDSKGELFELTAGYRAESMGQEILRVDFTAPVREVSRYNGLLWVPEGEAEVAEVQAIADHLVGTEGSAETSFWREKAHELLVGLMLHVLYRDSEPSLGGCRELLRSAPVPQILAEMALAEHDPGGGRG
jgi:type IV secretion system protein VirD4